MNKIVENDEPGSSEANHQDKVWPPEIEHRFEANTLILTRLQQDSVRYRWGHIAFALLAVLLGTQEYFSASHGWWSSPLYKTSFLCVCFVGFVGNLLRAFQGFQLKAMVDQNAHSQK